MIEKLNKGLVNTIYVWKLDRLSRNPIESGIIQHLLQKGIIKKIITHDRVYLPSDNALLMAVEGGMANQYSRDLSVNVKRGILSKAEKGWFPKVPPIGYLNSKTRDKGSQVILTDTRLFPIVRKMWDFMLTGNYTVPAIHKLAINEWGLTTPKRGKFGGKPMALSHMYKIFGNIFYTGDFTYDGIFYKGKHEAMITQDEFDKVQIIMGKRGKPRPKNHVFAYTGIMSCEECGAMVTASEKTKHIKSTGDVANYVYYHCTKRKFGANCKNAPIRAGELENQIVKVLDENSIHPKFYKLGLEVLKEIHSKESDTAQTIYENQNNLKEDLQKKRANATQFLLNGTISETEFNKIKSELDEQIHKQTTKVFQLENKIKSFNELTEDAFHFLKYAKEVFTDKNVDLQIKKEILSSLGWNHKLNSKKLLLDMHSWINVLKTGEINLLPQLNALELNKNPLTAKEIQKKEKVISRLRKTIYNVRQEILAEIGFLNPIYR